MCSFRVIWIYLHTSEWLEDTERGPTLFRMTAFTQKFGKRMSKEKNITEHNSPTSPTNTSSFRSKMSTHIFLIVSHARSSPNSNRSNPRHLRSRFKDRDRADGPHQCFLVHPVSQAARRNADDSEMRSRHLSLPHGLGVPFGFLLRVSYTKSWCPGDSSSGGLYLRMMHDVD